MSYLNVWFGLAVVIDPCWLIAIIAKITAVYELMIKDDWLMNDPFIPLHPNSTDGMKSWFGIIFSETHNCDWDIFFETSIFR